ncbi:MAG TPA: isoleucine--tRNA ligase [Kiritimatiellae bacterium]|nr:isoleucine--tRNA ligase [Kiritimatiellia bacterium]
MFEPVSSEVDFPELELSVIRFWEEQEIFPKSLKSRERAQEFVFYDGPPFATGLPHYGHLLAGTIKDIIPRYRTMRGYHVERRFGWDCHGLPVEYEVEQALGVGSKREIAALGVRRFNEACRSIVLRYTREWRRIVSRMGRWVDFNNEYRTMDRDYMESIWWIFKRLWEKGLIYRGHKILPYCPRCATPLSNFETNLGYRQLEDPSITVKFRSQRKPARFFLAWTTTPWTLPSNLALAVGPDIEYAVVRNPLGEEYVLAAKKVPEYFGLGEIQIMGRLSGRNLAGERYEPLFPYFASLEEQSCFRVVVGEFVSTEEGTGIVHIAPGFGEDDYRLGRKLGLPTVCPVDEEGRFTREVRDWSGMPVKEADKDIIERLRREGKLFRSQAIRHNYPHCWRCDTPLIYRAVTTWFLRVESIKDRLVRSNRKVHWVPQHVKEGRFGKWLENARDWAISRNRYWGTPLPIWTDPDGNEIVCIGSVKELERLSGKPVRDLHKHFVDDITVPSPSGKGVLRRIPEVLDCWFESGAMPYAQSHYPFENRERFERNFPADFIAEGLDQTRGWFYTLMVLSTALFDEPAFLNVIVNGLVLAEDGRKMSKRLKNYPDPQYILDTYGADALRLYMVNSPVVRGEDLCFSERGVKETLRKYLLPWWNAYVFLVTYARLDGWQPNGNGDGARFSLLDRWILSRLQWLIEEVRAAMDAYELQGAVRPLAEFIDDLTNWYIRRSRRRFWKSQDDDDKQAAYGTLYRVLLDLARVAAPFVPFITEAMYRNLRSGQMPESVHLCDFPDPDASLRDRELEQGMRTARDVIRAGRLLRSQHNIRTRQPLRAAFIAAPEAVMRRLREIPEDLIAEELNVREVALVCDLGTLASLSCKPQFSRIGPRYGPATGRVADLIRSLPHQQIVKLSQGDSVEVQDDELGVVRLTPADVVVEVVPARNALGIVSSGSIAVALDLNITQELALEGIARDFVNRVQRLRKELGLAISDRIRMGVQGSDRLLQALRENAEYVMAETLCISWELGRANADAKVVEIQGQEVRVQIEVAAPQG